MDIFNSDCLSHKRSFDDMLGAPEEFALGLGNDADFFDNMGCDEVDVLPVLERPQLFDSDNANKQDAEHNNSSSNNYHAVLTEKRNEVVAMADNIRRLKARLASLQHKQARHCPASSPTPGQPQGAPTHCLRVNGSIETVWYADRDLPHFTIEVVNPETNTVCTDLSDVKIEVTLRDGKGKDATNKLTASRNSSSSPAPSSPSSPSLSSSSSSASSSGCAQPLYFPVTAGSACVSGLRFSSVSSKCGGHFRLEFALVPAASTPSPSPTMATLVSAPVQVLSYRLFNCRKLSVEKLTPSDSVSKMKGIGALYAKRLAAIDVCTVGALAELVVNEEEGGSVVALLRRDRGGLTAAKLAEYVNQAKDIVARHNGETRNSSSSDRPAKRARVSPAPQPIAVVANVCGVPASPEVNKRALMLGLEHQHQAQPHPAMCAAALAHAFHTPAALGF